jgi:phosphoribosylformylglycinamidine synthase II
MPNRIEVTFKDGITDALGESVKKRIIEYLNLPVESVRTIDAYTIDKELDEKQLEFLGKELFADPITQRFSCDRPLAADFDWIIEVVFQPGVTDNVGKTSMTAIEDMLKLKFGQDEAVYTSKQYLIKGKKLAEADLDNIGKNLLANDLIQHWYIAGSASFMKNGLDISVPRVNIPHTPAVERIDLNISDEDLLRLSTERKLALNLVEMRIIKDYLLRQDVIAERSKVGLDSRATDAETEVIGQSWSEHCKHKIFNAKIRYRGENGEEQIDSLFDTFIKSSTKQLQQEFEWVASTLWDNSGVIRFNDKWLLAVKCETHNSPSNEEPYGGAITGIVGVYRDPMGTGQGCKLVFGTYGFCTGSPFYDGPLQPKLHPRRLLEGVRNGVEHGGNKHGVPTPYGLTFFDDGYMGKPAIYVMAGGLIPAEVHGRAGYEKKADPGDLIVMCGGRVGVDGIHGATESSMEAGGWITASHVQIGDPFTQKKMHDCLVEARDLGLYKCITDNGAGGLSSSVGEMAQFSNGFELHLDRVPLKYRGLDPWQILVSESQERMTLAVHPDNIEQIRELCKKHDVEMSVLGEFTNSGKFHTLYDGKTVTYLDMDFVHHGVPQMELEAGWLSPECRELYEPVIEEKTDHGSFLKEMLARVNICSKEYIVRQFDHEVQGTSTVKHLIGKENDVYNDAVVIRPVLDSNEGIAIAAGINPKYGRIDTYHMTACAIDEAIRKVIAVGAKPDHIALNDNFCWPSPLPAVNNPDAEYKLAQLVRANKALYDCTMAFKTPCISGKDSMSMDGTLTDVLGNLHRVSAMATLQFSAVGKVDDVEKCITADVKKAGDLVYILGITRNEMGGSEYYELHGETGLNVPMVDVKSAKQLYRALHSAIQEGMVQSIHGCYKGGLGVALAQTAFAGDLGLDIDLINVPAQGMMTDDTILYSESAGRFVVTVSPQNRKRFEQLLQSTVFGHIGSVTENDGFKVTGMKGAVIIQDSIEKLKGAWQSTFRGF